MASLRLRTLGPPDPVVFVALVTVLAFLLRVVVIDQGAVFDELFLYDIVHERGIRDVFTTVHDTESTPPLYFVLAWAAARLGEDDFLWIKLPSLLISTATVPLIYVLGVRTVGRTAALIGTTFFALAPFSIFYGTEGRAYATLAFLCAASTLCLVELLHSGRRWWGVAFVLTTAGAIYAHYTAVFVVAAQLAWALWTHRQRARDVLLAYAAVGLLYVPWIPSFLVQTKDSTAARIENLLPFTLPTFFDVLGRVWIGHPLARLETVPGVAGAVLVGVALTAALAFVAARAVHRRRLSMSRETALIVLLALATPVGALLYALGPDSVFVARNMSPSFPAAVLATGALLVAIRRPAVVGIATAVVLVGLSIGTVRTLQQDHHRAAFREVARDLDRTVRPGAPIYEVGYIGGPPGRQLGYYFHNAHEYFHNGRPLNPAYRMARRSGEFFVVIPSDGAEKFLPYLAMRERGFRLSKVERYAGLPELMVRRYVPTRGSPAS